MSEKRTRISLAQKLDIIEASKKRGFSIEDVMRQFLKSQKIAKQVPPVVDLSFEDQINNNVSGESSIGAAGTVTRTKFSNLKTIQMLSM